MSSRTSNLGLPDGPGYALSHVLEPWTPDVIDRALGQHLACPPGSTGPSLFRIALLFISLGGAVLTGVLAGGLVGGAIRRRLSHRSGALLAGGAGASVLALTAAAVSWRQIWWLIPVQLSDLLVGIAVIGATAAVGVPPLLLLRWVLRSPEPSWFERSAGLFLGITPGLACALAIGARWGSGCLSASIIPLIPPLMTVASVGVLAARLLAGQREVPPLENLAYCGVLMAWLIALLTPGFALVS